MNKIKERNTFSIEVNPGESSPAHWDHANPPSWILPTWTVNKENFTFSDPLSPEEVTAQRNALQLFPPT